MKRSLYLLRLTLDKHNRKLVTVNVSSKKLTEIILSMIESVVKPIERSSALKIIHAKYIFKIINSSTLEVKTCCAVESKSLFLPVCI